MLLWTTEKEHQSSLLTLVEGDEDILIELPSDFKVPNLVPLDGDGFAHGSLDRTRSKLAR